MVCVCWNENYRKLTTSDQNGMIIVWMLHKGMWYEEMINNRNKSTVRGMRWTPDGQRICIIYEDGAVIVGSVDGNRLWGKEIKTELAHVEWSPDGRNILFCTKSCEVHIYDSVGNFVSKLPLYCLEDSAAATSLVGIQWYDGAEGLLSLNQPVLAIGFENGRLQLMRDETDTAPVLVDAGMSLSTMRWNSNGSVLAVAGTLSTTNSSGERRDVCMVQFYTPNGQHMRTLKVPGSTMSALSWEGGSLRVALAVDSYIYFANIRPDYRWGFIEDTLIYSFTTPERHESALFFWNTKTDEGFTKILTKPLVTLHASGDCCVYATQAEDAANQHVLRLCSANGSPIDQKYVDLEPAFITLTRYHVVAASADAVYVWQYRTLTNKLTSVDAGTGSLRRKEGRERCWHIDDAIRSSSEPVAMVAGREASKDPIIAIAASSACLLVARESGALLRFSLPHIDLEHTYQIRGRTQSISINSDSTRVSLIDANGLLTLFDLDTTKGKGGEVLLPSAGEEPPVRFERKDVWQVLWAEDNASLFAVMEKSRMLVFRDLLPDEPVLTSGYLCSFCGLEVRAAMLDTIMREPRRPERRLMQTFQTMSLREAQTAVRESSLTDAFSFVEANPHPRLWRLVAETALQKLDFGVADKAFVHAEDYMGIHFVKRLRLLDDAKKQAAEVATYFSQFDEADKIYRELDRRDLALQMRANIGDWSKVVQLVQQGGGGDDTMLMKAWDKIGDHYVERGELEKAAKYYSQAQNMEALANCLYRAEDFAGLVKLATDLPDGTPLLKEIGRKLSSVGMANEASDAFVKGGDVSLAIDACLMLQHFQGAIEMAEQHNFPTVHKALAQYASQLIESGKLLQAVELYSKANQYTEAARLLTKIAADVGASRSNPLRAKKLFVAAALEIERMRKQMLESKAPQGGTQTAAQTLESLVTQVRRRICLSLTFQRSKTIGPHSPRHSTYALGTPSIRACPGRRRPLSQCALPHGELALPFL